MGRQASAAATPWYGLVAKAGACAFDAGSGEAKDSWPTTKWGTFNLAGTSRGSYFNDTSLTSW